MTQTIEENEEECPTPITRKFPPPPFRLRPAWFASSSNSPPSSSTSPRTHGPSIRRTELRPRLLLPLSRHRQARDPRPRRRRNIRLLAIHERRGLGTGEVTRKHCHRHKRWPVRRWYLRCPEFWGFNHSLERWQGANKRAGLYFRLV
jgi:hypothetical protein